MTKNNTINFNETNFQTDWNQFPEIIALSAANQADLHNRLLALQNQLENSSDSIIAASFVFIVVAGSI